MWDLNAIVYSRARRQLMASRSADSVADPVTPVTPVAPAADYKQLTTTQEPARDTGHRVTSGQQERSLANKDHK